MSPKYREENWNAVLEKWCATRDQAVAIYPPCHPVLCALDDIMLSVSLEDPMKYSESMSWYLREVYEAKQRGYVERRA